MQACLLLDVEPYLYRDDVKHALRAMFNAEAVSYFPDVRMNTEHALPDMADWRGDHYKSSDESNPPAGCANCSCARRGTRCCSGRRSRASGSRKAEVRHQECGHLFRPNEHSLYREEDEITARLEGPRRNPPKEIRVRFRDPQGRSPASVSVNQKPWTDVTADWVRLPGDIGSAAITARYSTSADR